MKVASGASLCFLILFRSCLPIDGIDLQTDDTQCPCRLILTRGGCLTLRARDFLPLAHEEAVCFWLTVVSSYISQYSDYRLRYRSSVMFSNMDQASDYRLRVIEYGFSVRMSVKVSNID